ncbi:Glycogen phosphorylase [Clostridiaceae bacterium JG1575]|nr:Glycogen phosphorylase [Clostridiaceae bacterium JG1575]
MSEQSPRTNDPERLFALTPEKLAREAASHYGKEFTALSAKEQYRCVSAALMSAIAPLWHDSAVQQETGKRACYLSSEFLMGRALSNNLQNLNALVPLQETLKALGVDLLSLQDTEEDPGLGNGGLGRLAACFLDSAATLELPLMGYGIRYQYGMFRQQIINGMQVEEGDDWGAFEDPWALRKPQERILIHFGDQSVWAVPYDTPIIGYGAKTINTLRLFAAEPVEAFHFEAFNDGRYLESVTEAVAARTISRVLYPNDNTREGKALRLKQEYFFTSAALTDLMRAHKKKGRAPEDFFKYHAVQLNDTHPSLAVPELIRLLKEEGLSFEEAFEATFQTLSYTNHTILAEALEKWDMALFQEILPKMYELIEAIQNKWDRELLERGEPQAIREELAILDEHEHVARMAYLALYGTHAVNGVAKMHTEILKHQELKHWYRLYPERFQNKTNGITQRRWFLHANHEMADFVSELLGSKDWIVDLSQLANLKPLATDEAVLSRFWEIKKRKKHALLQYVRFNEGTALDPDAIFDVQVKRIHEYKRQLLNAFHLLDLYYRIQEEDPTALCRRNVLIGGKAAPGYFRAKGIIKFINEIKNLIERDAKVREYLKVVFIENYNVSYAERIFPAADLSEQISTAGKEASGTGNMKFMLNGAVTIGTLDGANVEIVEEAGAQNNFIFGRTAQELFALRPSYNPKALLQEVPGLERVVQSLVDGTFDDDGTGAFADIHRSLLEGTSWEAPDVYFVLADFDEYRNAQNRAAQVFADPLQFARMGFLNMASSGKFSSDRTIREYAKDIWNVSPAAR